ncbi:ABC transporter substrate-binding protein, partial [Salmonella enterica]|uniref:ABC transporter substrate-binding protein n=1 Tax=Salmonella enterica TaxID=28901 RepID=UPI003FA7400B
LATTRGLLRLTDPRRFGAAVWSPSRETGEAGKLLAGLGIEPFDAAFTAAWLHERLRGRRVAFAKGTMTQLPANRLLAAAGLSERDVRVVSLDTATQLAALATKDIDAVFGSAVLLKQRNQGLARIVGSTKSEPGFTGQSLMLVTERFAQEQPDAVNTVVRTFVRSAHGAS